MHYDVGVFLVIMSCATLKVVQGYAINCTVVICQVPECPKPIPSDSQNGRCCPICPKCPVKGQIFKECGSACPPNCTDPTPFCTKQCVARCECPQGQVIDQASNTCVNVIDCPSIPKRKRFSGTPCPPGVDLVNCFVDPCLSATCPAHPTAVCVANYCGGCNAEFFDALGNDVTNSCDNVI